MASETTLQPLDYAILAVTTLASLGIGFYFACFAGKQKTTAVYFKGGRNMHTIPIVMSMLAGHITSNMMLGFPTEVYHFGADYCYTALGAFIAGPIAIYGFLPVFYKLQITSIHQYLQYRFCKKLKSFNSILGIFSLVIFAGFVVYAPALALSQATGLDVWSSIVTTVLIGTTYTSIGGIKAVVWTDVLQLLIFGVSMIAVLIKGCAHVGGISYIISKNIEGKRLSTLSFSMDPTVRLTAWGLIISSTLQSLMLYGASQITLQRYLCCPNKKAAQRSTWLNVGLYLPITIIYCCIGLILYAMYWNCDPLSSQQIQKPDQIFPLFVMQTMSSIPGMPGLFVAGIYSAALSTLSSVLNSLAAITLEDHIKPRCKNLSDKKATYVAKCIAVVYGLICFPVIAVIMNLGSLVQAMPYMMGSSMGASFGLFFLGLLIPWANSKGAILGMVCSLAVSSWISIGVQIYRPPPTSLLPTSTVNCSDILGDWTPRPRPNIAAEYISSIYRISYLWIMPTGFTVTVLIGSFSSLFIGSNTNLDVNLLSPFVKALMQKCFSKKYKELVANYKSIPVQEKIANGFNHAIDEVKADELIRSEANDML